MNKLPQSKIQNLKSKTDCRPRRKKSDCRKQKFCAKMKKAASRGTLRAHFGPDRAHKIFLFRNSPKFLTKGKIFPDSLPFSIFGLVFSGAAGRLFAGAAAPEAPNCFSVIQLSNNEKGAARIGFSSWKPRVAAPKTFFEFDPLRGSHSPNFLVSGAGTPLPQFQISFSS